MDVLYTFPSDKEWCIVKQLTQDTNTSELITC